MTSSPLGNRTFSNCIQPPWRHLGGAMSAQPLPGNTRAGKSNVQRQGKGRPMRHLLPQEWLGIGAAWGSSLGRTLALVALAGVASAGTAAAREPDWPAAERELRELLGA